MHGQSDDACMFVNTGSLRCRSHLLCSCQVSKLHPITAKSWPVHIVLQIVRFWVAQLSKVSPVFPAAAAHHWHGIAALVGLMLEHRCVQNPQHA